MRALKIAVWVIVLSLLVGAGSTFAPDIKQKYKEFQAARAEANKPVVSYKVDNNMFRSYRPPEMPDTNYVLELHPGQTVELKNRLISNMSRKEAAKLTITAKGLLKAEFKSDSSGNAVIGPGQTINIKMYADVPSYLKPGDYQGSLDIVLQKPAGDILPAMLKPISFTARVLPNDLEMNRFNNDRGKWGFLDRFSNVVIPPQFDKVGAFSEGLCAVMLNGRWGYINTTGNYLVVPKYPEALPFTSGLAGVRIAADQWGYINSQDVFVIKPQFVSGTSFVYAGGEQAIVKCSDGKWYYIDKTGNKLRPAKPVQSE